VEDIIAIDYSDRKAFIPTLANKSLTNDNNNLDTLIKTAVSKLKCQAPYSSTPSIAKRVKIKIAAS
jgi:hypothetical protein